MKACLQKIRWQILMPALLAVFIPLQTMALEVNTHKAINELIANKNSAFGNFFLHQYLIERLGMVEGVETVINKKFIMKYISDGGVYEDTPDGCVPYWRSRNHFLNPIDGSGFSGWWDTGILEGISAIDWALLPGNTQSCG